MKQISLRTLIDDKAELTELQKDSLYDLLSKHCRADTRKSLYRRIFECPLSLWDSFGIYSRVMAESDGTFSYCAGQDYTSEIATVRKCVLGK